MIRAEPEDLGAKEIEQLRDAMIESIPSAARAAADSQLASIQRSLSAFSRSGGLYHSFRSVEVSPGVFDVRSDSEHANVTDLGGTIRAHGGGYLMIPFADGYARVREVKIGGHRFIDQADNPVALQEAFADAVIKGIGA